MERSKLRQRLSVMAFCVCPAVWFLGMAALCHCPGIWLMAGVIALVPAFLGPTRLQRLMGVLFLIFSVGSAAEEFKAYARQQAAVERARQAAMERSGGSAATTQPTTRP